MAEEFNDLSLNCSCIEHGLRSSESLRDDNEYGFLEIYVGEGPIHINRVNISEELELAFVGFELCYRVEAKRLIDELRPKVATSDTNGHYARDRLAGIAEMDATSNLL